MAQNNDFTGNSTVSPTNPICAEEYTVRRGDSFYLISHKLGVPLRDLLAANRDIHPARLMVGDVLCIPREENSHSTGNENGMNGTNGSNGTNGTNGMNGNNANGMNGTNGTNGANSSNSMNGTNGTGNGTSGSGNGTQENGEIEVEPAPTEPACPAEDALTVQSGQTVADIQLRNLVSRNTLTTANPAVDLDQLEAGQVLCVPKENIPCPIPSTYQLGDGESLESVAIRFNLPVASILRSNPCLAPQDFEAGVTIILPR